MKIILISFSILPSLQNYLYNSYTMLGKMGNEVVTIGSSTIQAKDINISEDNILVKTPDTPGLSLKSLTIMNKSFKQVMSFIEKIRPDVIHFISKHTWNYLLIKKIRKIYPNLCIIHTMHDPIGHSGEKIGKKVLFYNKTLSKNIDGIIVHSNKSYHDAISHLKPPVPVYKAPLGEMAWKNYTVSNETKKVLVFGRLNPYKGCEFIPLIANKLYELDKTIKIIVAGKLSKEIKNNLIKKINQCKNIELNSGFIPEEQLDNYFYNSDLVLITHKTISQSGIILQAYRHSKAVLSFNIDGISEFVVNDYNGKLVEKFNIDEYAGMICELVNNKNILKMLSYNAWKKGKELFSIEEMCKVFIDVYKKSQSIN